MSAIPLRAGLIRLAHAHPEFRAKLLPILKRGTVRTAARATRLKLDITLKDSTVIPKASLATVEFTPDRPSISILKVEGRNEPIKVSTINLHKYLAGYKVPPSRAQLNKWAAASVCQTVTGEMVEMDGWGSDGSPSWMLVLGMI